MYKKKKALQRASELVAGHKMASMSLSAGPRGRWRARRALGNDGASMQRLLGHWSFGFNT
jgi:hypothetical protein